MVLSMAGCFNEPRDDLTSPEPTGQSPSESNSTTSLRPEPSGEAEANQIEWTSCVGLGFGLETPTPIVSGARPPDWGPSEDVLNAVVTDIIYNVNQCERVSWGGFERGPIFTMMEIHNGFQAPPQCLEGAGQLQFMIQSIWFSDPDLVEFAKSRFGMPAALGEFGFELSTTGITHVSTWVWNLPGGAVSEANFVSRDDALLNPFDPVWRQYWINGSGVSYMDLTQEYVSPEPAPGAAYGVLPAPMLYGQSMPSESFFTPDRADQKLEESWSASISQFEDTQCEAPF